MPADNQINAEGGWAGPIDIMLKLIVPDTKSQYCGHCFHFQFWSFNFGGMPIIFWDALSKGPLDPIWGRPHLQCIFLYWAVPWTRGKVAGMQKHIDLFKRVPGLSSPSFTWPPFGARSKWGSFCCCSGELGTTFSESPWGSHCTASLRRARMGGASMEVAWVWGHFKNKRPMPLIVMTFTPRKGFPDWSFFDRLPMEFGCLRYSHNFFLFCEEK